MWIEVTGLYPEDREQVYALMTELEGEVLPRDRFDRAFDAYLQDEGIHCMVARDGKCVIGFISVHSRWLMHHVSPVCEVQELIVSAEYRGKGIGKELLNAAKRIAEKGGSPQLEVCCNVGNCSGQKFYESCGMKWSHKKYIWKPE